MLNQLVNDVVKDYLVVGVTSLKNLKRRRKEALQINFKDLNLPTYNHSNFTGYQG